MGIENNKIIIDYVESICSHVKQKEVHSDIKSEIQGHIEERVYDYINEGFSEEDAAVKAVKDMGEADLIGKDLNKVYKQRPNIEILILTLILTSIGLVTLYFIDLYNNSLFGVPKGVFEKSIIWILIGMAVAVMLYFFDYRKIKKYSWHLFIAVNGILIYTLFIGRKINGIKRLSIGSMDIGIVYIAPAILGIALCGIFIDYEFKTLKNYIIGLLLLSVPFILILKFPSIFAALFYLIIFITVSISAKKKPLFFISVSLVIFSVFFKIFILNVYFRYDKIMSFLNPYKNPMGSGYIRIQINNLINSAGMFGKGLGIQKLNIIDAHTEMILAYIIHCFGWLAGILLAAVIAIFIIKIFKMKNVVKNSYGKLLVFCISTILSVQFILNIFMVLGLSPIVEVNLPFISYGGTQFIVNMAFIGILSSVYRRKELKETLKLNQI